MIERCKNLEELWQYTLELNNRHFSDNKLMPILGNGKSYKPKVMFVFINPTARNISSDKNWQGPRFPFIGTKHIWRIFNKAGLLDNRLINEINADSNWSIEFTNKVLQYLNDRKFYLTNIVKWTGHDATLPDSEKIRLFLPILEREIEIVRPEYIVTFGLIPFRNLIKQSIKLSDYYYDAIKNGKLKTYDLLVNTTKTKVIPCYFPVGRGNPKRAVELLKLTNILYSSSETEHSVQLNQ